MKIAESFFAKAEILQVLEMILFFSIRSNDCHCQCQTSGERCFDLGPERLGRKEIVLNIPQSLLVCNQNEWNESCSSPFYTNTPDPETGTILEQIFSGKLHAGKWELWKRREGEFALRVLSIPCRQVSAGTHWSPDGVLCAVPSSVWWFPYLFTSLWK